MRQYVCHNPPGVWTHHFFAAIAKAKGREIELCKTPDLRAELGIWLDLSATSQEGPWYKPRHFAPQIAVAASDASSNQWGCVVSMAGGEFSASGGFPCEWLPCHIDAKEMFALLDVLTECCRAHLGRLRRAQLVMDVGNRSVVDTFKTGRSKNPSVDGVLPSAPGTAPARAASDGRRPPPRGGRI